MLAMPFSATLLAKLLELSSIFQPVMSIARVPVFVTSNQSAPYGLLPLLHGDTSEMIGTCTIVPGEPISPPATNAPLRPATLSVEISGGVPVLLPRPAALSNVAGGADAPKRDAGDAVAAGVEEVDRVAARAQADAAAAVGADLKADRRARAEPRRRERRGRRRRRPR